MEAATRFEVDLDGDNVYVRLEFEDGAALYGEAFLDENGVYVWGEDTSDLTLRPRITYPGDGPPR